MSQANFWDRRRANVAVEAKQVEIAKVEADLADRTDEEILAELDLPVPEDVADPDQIRAFLTKAVPQRIKTRALRQLWRINPMLANLDGLVDYGEDYTDSATVVENLQTAYQVGKGMVAKIEALAAPEQQDAVETPDVEDEEELPELVLASAPEPEMAEPDELPSAPLRRRMTFAFDPTPEGAT
ncbi:DUF3306 domain-containing protein [Roseobacter sp. CCS2]|uniref:DUF3306 domain-containing protein n=1 Tax=Roseobacter sp. CCS2 TaxID=391593 RepID=UPI0000F403B3|nr:DUF3306 domain-containing protein [Roseobacter sp. CCS2]EBA13956.1 hypothetical protein RCCS2_08704 [Roseobacter sp. CCS2]